MVPSSDARSLEDVWRLQAELNRRSGFDTAALGEKLPLRKVAEPTANPQVRAEIGWALANYVDALASECHELLGCIAWKHWCREAREGRRYELLNPQNARVEAIDMLFFWVSICQLLGLSPQDVYELYTQKLGLNHRRLDENRSQADHDRFEDENREIK